MTIHKTLSLLLVALCYFSPAMAQYTDTVTSKISKTASGELVKTILLQNKKIVTYRSFLLPVGMIGYGIASLNSKGLKHVNEKIKEEIWTEAPHKKTPIDNYLQFAPAAAVYGLNMAGIKGKNNLRDRSIIYLMSNAMLNVSISSIKNTTRQQRPDGSAYNSFPSGHTAEAFASAEFLRQEYREVSPFYGIAGYAVATATGLLRMYNNKHWLSDVVAGAGIGIASTKLAYCLYPLIKRKLFKNRTMNAIVMPYYKNTGAGVSMIYNIN